MTQPSIAWFLYDHRLSDNPALTAAASTGPFLPVYVHDPAAEGSWAPGAARRWWIHHSLNALNASLKNLGLDLLVKQGDTAQELLSLCESVGARVIHCNARALPSLRERDRQLKKTLAEAGVELRVHGGSALLHDPRKILTGSGNPYTVFTPFWRKFQAEVEPGDALPVPDLGAEHRVAGAPESVGVDGLALLPRIKWDAGFYDHWVPGEDDAQRRLQSFLERPVHSYKEHRDVPSLDGTSGLSPYLVHGEISPRQIWHAARRFREEHRGTPAEVEGEHFQRELAWREFSYHVLNANPEIPEEPLRQKWAAFPWRDDADALAAWQRGQTGFPIVDAGMRQLWESGWMHNRVRMIVASFLTKDLLVPWQEGARWFWDTLVDADLANNTMGWQWAAGCGADAQPFFRIFNPTSQGLKFDAGGEYVKRWVPELRGLGGKQIHAPEAGDLFGGSASYASPIVDHKAARQRALDALDRMKTEVGD
jgi:deoxyribodipyrimidine photo-lyase